MADCAHSTVFTNDSSCETPDLLRQAFQEVIGDDENEFVAYLHGQDDQPQKIYLTESQASALRINFLVNNDQVLRDITYADTSNGCDDDIPNTTAMVSEELSPQHDETIEPLNFPEVVDADINETTKVDGSLLGWTCSESDNASLQTQAIQIHQLNLNGNPEESLLRRVASQQNGNIPKSVCCNNNNNNINITDP